MFRSKILSLLASIFYILIPIISCVWYIASVDKRIALLEDDYRFFAQELQELKAEHNHMQDKIDEIFNELLNENSTKNASSIRKCAKKVTGHLVYSFNRNIYFFINYSIG